MKVGFIGLGAMGFPMAGHLARAGHAVAVYNRTRGKSEAWAEKYGGEVSDSPSALAVGKDIVFACVGRDDDVAEVFGGKHGAIAAIGSGGICVDCTTTSARLARSLAQQATDCGAQFIDAPVSGGQAGAQNGALTVMCGGSAEAFSRAEPVIASFASKVTLMGAAGSGQLTKMSNQIAIAGLVQALAESLAFARCAGIDETKMLETISGGAAQSWQMDNRGSTMIAGKYDFGFAVKWMRKDLGIVLEEARGNGAKVPVTALVDQFYADLMTAEGENLDTSSLLLRLQRP